MKWRTFAQWEIRRRAVVSGRVFDGAGKPFTDAASLSLWRVPDETVRSLSTPKGKGKKAQPVLDAQTQKTRRYACHMHPDGHFFFLDVPAGRYVLNRVDASGAVDTSFVCISLPPFDRKAKMPIVNIEFEMAPRADRADLPSGRQVAGQDFVTNPN